MGSVTLKHEKIGTNRFEIVFVTQFRMYAQQTRIPSDSPEGSFKDTMTTKTYRTGIFLNADSDGNYISEAYQNQQKDK